MPGPLAAAERLVSILPHLPGWPSGSFVDIPKIPRRMRSFTGPAKADVHFSVRNAFQTEEH